MSIPPSQRPQVVLPPENCPLCEGPNECQRCTNSPDKGPCWCEQHAFPDELLARVPDEARNLACVCRSCLVKAWKARPSPRAGAGDFYLDPASGFLVFTAQYLRRRGYCCDSGCRHCPWSSPPPVDEQHASNIAASGRVAAAIGLRLVMLLVLGLEAFSPILAGSFTETFASDPARRGWRTDGASDLFRWDEAAGRLDVTWDSSRPHSFFSHALETPVGMGDTFRFGLDLVLTDARGGARPPRTGAMQVAFGLLNRDRALQEHYARAAGKGHDLVEFNWFPEGEFPGFGVVEPTVSPAVFSSAGRVAASFTFPLELVIGAAYRIQCAYEPANRRLTTTLVADGAELSIRSVTLPADFGEFSLNAFAVMNWTDADAPFDSLLAHGHVDNITWEVPDPPIGRITMESEGVVAFASQLGWRYQLEAADQPSGWSVVAQASGTGEAMVLVDLRDAFFRTQFYRVRADRE